MTNDRTTPDSADAADSGAKRRALVVTCVALFAATFLLSTAWSIVIGPFRGMDEFDHALRADSVSKGEWQADGDGLVVTDRDFYDAILPVCVSRRWAADACDPSATPTEDLVVIESTAAAYNPVFYALIGTATSAFDGYDRLYAMRSLLTAVNSLILTLALLIALRCFTTRWPAWAIVLTMTPQAGAAAMVVAPNGWESSCALLVWVCLLATTFGRLSPAWSRRLPLIALVAGSFVGFLRSLGPLWLVCIVCTVLIAAGMRGPQTGLVVRVRQHGTSRAWIACGVAWVVASGLGLTWALVSNTNSIAAAKGGDSTTLLTATAQADEAPLVARPVVWLFQLVGALPYRDQPLPLETYAVAVILWIGLTVLVVPAAATPLRRAVGAVALVSLAIPLTFAIVTDVGSLWQGRYGWPLAMGVFLVLGVAMERRATPVSRRAEAIAASVVVVTLALVTARSLLHVAVGERADSPLSGQSAWWTLPDPVVVGIALASFAVAACAIATSPARPRPLTATESAQDAAPAEGTTRHSPK